MGPDDVADVPEARVAYVDGYGNLKTGSFAVEPRQLAFASGSSGWPLNGGPPVRSIELFLRGGNAWEAFGRPAVGARI
jgi:hypothetical protein